MPDQIPKKFVFNNDANKLYLLAVDIIDYIKRTVPTGEHTVSKLKMILVELLTNSLKHSGQQETIIEVAFTDDRIILTKTDSGNPLTIKSDGKLFEWPLPGRHYNSQVITVYEDDICILKGEFYDNCSLKFFIEESEINTTVDINNLSEHFGLMIITRACNLFEYKYDIETGTNNFIVTLCLAH